MQAAQAQTGQGCRGAGVQRRRGAGVQLLCEALHRGSAQPSKGCDGLLAHARLRVPEQDQVALDLLYV